MRAFKEQVAQDFGRASKLPRIISAITHNVEVGGEVGLQRQDVLPYALFAATLPGGHLFQPKIDGVDRLLPS